MSPKLPFYVDGSFFYAGVYQIEILLKFCNRIFILS